MGSFQQVIMGATCLVAAFFFGSYLHNRPASNEKGDGIDVAAADPLDSIFAFGKAKQQASLNGPTSTQASLPETHAAAPDLAKRSLVDRVNSAIDSSEQISRPVATVQNEQRTEDPNPATARNAKTQRKPVVPDFSDLASRFRDTPLEFSESAATDESRPSAIHESERVQGFNTIDDAPEVVIRKPQKLTPLQDFANQVDRLERDRKKNGSEQEFATNENVDRWRVNRSEEIDRFRSQGMTPLPDPQPRTTIDDLVAEQSANYLLDSDENTSTFATDPIKDDWASTKRQEITRQAANRGRDILDIDDPGKRFHSVLSTSESKSAQQSFGRPEPDFETDYYAPVKPDVVPDRSRVQMRRIPRQNSNWQSRSNIETGFQASTYRIQPGDTLQSISVRFYGVPDHYLDLYKANRDILDRITSSPQGVVIEIPKLNN